MPTAAGALEESTIPLCFYLDAVEGRRYVCFAETYADKLAWLQAIAAAVGQDCGAPKPRLEDTYKAQVEAADASEPWAHVADGLRLSKLKQSAQAQVAFDRAIAAADAGGGEAGCKVYARYEVGKLLAAQGRVKEVSDHARVLHCRRVVCERARM